MMPTLTDEGRALAAQIEDTALRERMSAWLNGVQIMEEINNDLVTDSMAQEQARAGAMGNMRVHGGGWRGWRG
jgi:hypothetical protein